MGFFKPKDNQDPFDFRFCGLVVATSGISAIPIGVNFVITLCGETIVLKDSSLSFHINQSQVIGVGIYGKRESVSSNKSVLGRSLVGGAIAGGTGAIVGAISGAGSKNKMQQHFYNYLSFMSSSNELCRIDFEVFPPMDNVRKFNQAVMPTSKEAIQL